MGAPQGNKNAEIPFDVEQFEQMCHIQCTQTEIAAVLKMSVDTLENKVKEHYGGRLFSDVYAEKREGGKQSLRRAQWATAIQAKNPIMQIFLGKNMLGQADKLDVDHSGEITQRQELSGLSDAELEQLHGLLAKGQAPST